MFLRLVHFAGEIGVSLLGRRERREKKKKKKRKTIREHASNIHNFREGDAASLQLRDLQLKTGYFAMFPRKASKQASKRYEHNLNKQKPHRKA